MTDDELERWASNEGSNKPLVFISAKSEDYPYANRVFKFLQDNNINAFLSKRSLADHGDADFRRVIDNMLEIADHMIVVSSSREYVESEWVRREWGLFINEKLAGRKPGNIIIITMGALKFEELPVSLRGYEVFDGKNLSRILTFVSHKPGERRGATLDTPRFFRENLEPIRLRSIGFSSKFRLKDNLRYPTFSKAHSFTFDDQMVLLLSAYNKRTKEKRCRLPSWLLIWKKGKFVDCTVFAPPSVAPKDDFLIQVFVHLPNQASKVVESAKHFDEETEIRGYTNLEIRVKAYSKLGFHLHMPDLLVNENFHSLTWNGRPGAVQFHVSVQENAEPRNVVGKVTVSQGSVPIGHIIFKIKILPAFSLRQNGINIPVGETSKTYTTAFISYASEDRNKVLPRVQMLKYFGIKYFQDILDLSPGDRWQRRLFSFIDRADLFLLFWSNNSKNSQWVRKETQYALARKGESDDAPPAIIPVIIEIPPPLPPWEELSHLHFNDREVYFILSS